MKYLYNYFFKDLTIEFKGYNKSKLIKDIIAGITVTAVALPLCLALGINSGVGPLSGLISSIIAGLIVSIFCGGSYQIGGPTAAMTIILFSLFSTYGYMGVFITGLFSGIFLLIAGIIKLGKFISFIPLSVITGFTAGLACNIIIGQINNFFGVYNKGISVVDKVIDFNSNGFSPNLTSMILGGLVLLFLIFYPKKLQKIIPGSLCAIIIVTFINMIFNLPVDVVGEIPKTLLPNNRLILNSEALANLDKFIIPGLSIMILCTIESLLCGKSGSSATGKKFNADKELIAQGIGNIIIPFFGGIPTTSVLARTSVGIKANTQSRITPIVQSLMLILCMFVLSGFMSKIPMCVLASILIYTAINMNDFKSIKYIFKNKISMSIVKFFATMIITVIFDLTLAIFVGSLLGILLFVNKIAQLDITVKDIDVESIIGKNEDKTSIEKLFSKTKVVYITGPIFFGAISNFDDMVKIDTVDTLIFSMRGVPMLDASGAQMLHDMCLEYQNKSISVYFCGVCDSVYKSMKKTAIVKLIGEDNFYWSADKVISEIKLSINS